MVDQVDHLQMESVGCGWTIRTCRNDGRAKTGGYFCNYVSEEEARITLRTRLQKFEPSEFYLLYPSWRFYFSCNIVLHDYVYIVEGKFGSQKGLAAGSEVADFGLKIPFGMLSQMTEYWGTAGSDIRAWTGRLLAYCRKIPRQAIYAEVYYILRTIVNAYRITIAIVLYCEVGKV